MNQTIGGGVSPLTLNFIKSLEGYTPQPKWDYKQHSVGFGTRWNPGDPVGTRSDHETALAREASKVGRWLDANVTVPLDPGKRAGLISAGLNLGTGVKGIGRLLGDINAGNWESVARRLPTFNKAGGEVNQGLINRRAKEVEMLLGRKPTDGYIGGTAAAPAQTVQQPVAPEQLVPPSGRYSKLADALMAQAAGAKPRGWGELLNAFGSAALGYSLADKEDTKQQEYQSKLAKMLGGTATEELPQALISSGNPELMQAGLRAKLAPAPKQPAAIQGYEVAKQQGFQGSFLDYQKELKKAGASSVNVETKQEGEYEKTRGKALGEQFGKIMQDAQDATARIGQLNSIDALLSNPDVYTGTGAESINALKRFGKSFLGMDVAGVADADAARRISTEMALSLKSDLPGPMSNADREFLQNIPPNIGDTAEGRKLLVNLMKNKEQRKIQVARLAREYRAQHGGRIDDGFYDALAQYNEANPLVTPDMIEQMRQSAVHTPQPSPAAGVPDEFKKRWGLE